MNALASCKQQIHSHANVWSYGEAIAIHMRKIYLDLLNLCINGHNAIINVEIICRDRERKKTQLKANERTGSVCGKERESKRKRKEEKRLCSVEKHARIKIY